MQLPGGDTHRIADVRNAARVQNERPQLHREGEGLA